MAFKRSQDDGSKLHSTGALARLRAVRMTAARLPADSLNVRTTVITATAAGGGWTYTTVIADAAELLDTVPNRESSELRWVAETSPEGSSGSPRSGRRER